MTDVQKLEALHDERERHYQKGRHSIAEFYTWHRRFVSLVVGMLCAIYHRLEKLEKND